MLSRVADNLYWFGRYLNRIESTARLVNVTTSLLLDLPPGMSFAWSSLIDIVGARETFGHRYADADEAEIVHFLLLDPENPGSVRSSVDRTREILRVSRDTFPDELWEKLSHVHLLVHEDAAPQLARRYRGEFLTRLIDAGALIAGILSSNMSHDVGFAFVEIGTNVEQADMTTRIIDTRSVTLRSPHRLGDASTFEHLQWVSVLRSLTAEQMFRRHVRQRLTGANVLRFLLQNPEFPRSVLACLLRVDAAVANLPDPAPVLAAASRPIALVREADPELIAGRALSGFVDDVQVGLAGVHEALQAAYFRS